MTNEQAVEVGLIELEDGWPHWPVLPVKRYVDHKLETGVLLGRSFSAKRGDPFKFYANANMWAPVDTWGEPVEVTAEELVEKGWVGD